MNLFLLILSQSNTTTLKIPIVIENDYATIHRLPNLRDDPRHNLGTSVFNQIVKE